MNLTRDPVQSLLVKMAVPASTGFLFNTLYNVTDTYWGGAISTDALAALSLSFPVFMILLALGQGISSGASALIANALGADQEDRAILLQAQAIELAIIVALVFTLPIVLLLPTIFRLMGAEPNLLETARRYSSVLVGGGIFFIVNAVLNAGLSARGDTTSYRNFLIAGFVLNIGLDPLLLFGLTVGGVHVIPAFREVGIAAATILIQAGGTLYLVRQLIRSGSIGTRAIGFSRFGVRFEIWGEIIQQGVPSALNMAAIALGTFVITYFIARFGTTAVAAYGSALRIEQIALIPTIGLNIALASMVGQNNGANRLDRVQESYHTSLKLGALVMAGILTPVLIFGRTLIAIFTENPLVISTGITYLYIQGLTFYSYVLMNQSNAVLQGLKRPGMIMWVGLYRQVLAPFIVFPLLISAGDLGIRGVWWGLVFINWSAAIFTWRYATRVIDAAIRVNLPVDDLY